MSNVKEHLLLIWRNERSSGVFRRIQARLTHKPEFMLLNIWRADCEDVAEVPPPQSGIEIKQLGFDDTQEIQAVAQTKFYTSSEEDVREHLKEGQLCYVAKSHGQVVSNFWVIQKSFYEGYLKRSIYLDEDEVYLLGFYTVPEFRGAGIFPFLSSRVVKDFSFAGHKSHAFAFVRLDNRASMNTLRKLHFKKMGLIGFFQVIGIRAHFIFGRAALAQRNRRFSVSILQG